MDTRYDVLCILLPLIFTSSFMHALFFSHPSSVTFLTLPCSSLVPLSLVLLCPTFLPYHLLPSLPQVHNGNTRKLVAKGALECVLTALQKYPQDIAIQRAGERIRE